MTTTAEQYKPPRRTLQPEPGAGTLHGQRQRSVLLPWLRGQAINVTRHAAALRPFKRGEFGNDSASPTEGHVEAVNKLIVRLRENLLKKAGMVTDAVQAA